MKNVMRQTVQAGSLASESREDADGRHPLSLGFGVSEVGELNRCLPRGPFQQEPLWANPAPGLVSVGPGQATPSHQAPGSAPLSGNTSLASLIWHRIK